VLNSVAVGTLAPGKQVSGLVCHGFSLLLKSSQGSMSSMSSKSASDTGSSQLWIEFSVDGGGGNPGDERVELPVLQGSVERDARGAAEILVVARRLEVPDAVELHEFSGDDTLDPRVVDELGSWERGLDVVFELAHAPVGIEHGPPVSVLLDEDVGRDRSPSLVEDELLDTVHVFAGDDPVFDEEVLLAGVELDRHRAGVDQAWVDPNKKCYNGHEW